MDYIFEKGKFVESELESAIISLFDQYEYYNYVSGETIERKFKDVLIYSDLRAYLSKKYSCLTQNEISRVIALLDNIPSVPLYEGARATYRMLSEGFDLLRDDVTQTAVHIDFIDFDNIANNNFKIVNQYTVEDVQTRRPDMLVFINGIPVTIFEFKSAIEEDATIHNAWEQVTIRYARDIPALLKYCTMAVISDGVNTKLGTIFTPYKFFYSWNKANETDTVANGISSLFTMIEGAFAPDRLLQVFRDFVFYPDDSKKSEAIICRYPQFLPQIRCWKA